MAGFEELGLSEALVANAREQAFDTPSALQRSIIPVIRRGGNAIVRASSGSGITAAYALALLDQFGERTGTHALVIVPTAERAERVANTIARLAQGLPARAAALTNAWSAAGDATIVVASAEKLLGAVEESQIKLEGVQAVVVDNAAAIVNLTGESALEKIFSSLPREGQRIFISSDMTDPVRKFAESHARKALTFPPRPAVEDSSERPDPVMRLRYAVADNERKTDMIARYARATNGPITLLCRSATTARDAARQLSGRGFDVTAATYDGFDESERHGAVYAYDAPFSAEQITEAFRDGDILLCERHELPHLKQIAADANVRIEAAKTPTAEADSLNAFRNEIRRAASEEDLEAQLLLLEPLFREMAPEEVAAAAVALLRARRPVKAEKTGGARAGTQTWSRLFLSVGERDGVRPADVVGAITGESGVKGDEVGKVEIRDTFSVVEVASTAAERVIQAMNGTTMKGRALRVDYDRKTASTPSRGGSGGDRPRSRPGEDRPRSRPSSDRPRSGPSDRPRSGPSRGPSSGGNRREGGRPPSKRDR